MAFNLPAAQYLMRTNASNNRVSVDASASTKVMLTSVQFSAPNRIQVGRLNFKIMSYIDTQAPTPEPEEIDE